MEEQRNPKMINNPVDKDEKQVYRTRNQNGPKLCNKMPKLAIKETRLRKMEQSDHTKCWQGCGEKDMLLELWWICKLLQPL